MKLSLFSIILAYFALTACTETKVEAKCFAQASPGANPCSSTSSDGSATDASSLKVLPWICEGKALPICYQGSETIFTKVYPKLDKETCEVLDTPKEHVVEIEKCRIPESLLREVNSFLPKGLEILGIQKGSLKSGDPIYRVTYRNGFDSIAQIFNASGKILPLETKLDPNEVEPKPGVACNEGYPVFCRKQADGTYKYDDPIRIETDTCPIYEAPPGTVDSSFCTP